MKSFIWKKKKIYLKISCSLPFTKNMVDGDEHVSFELLTKWTNLKAVIAGAGPGGPASSPSRSSSSSSMKSYPCANITQ